VPHSQLCHLHLFFSRRYYARLNRIHFKACLVVSVARFRRLWPTQGHLRLALLVGMWSCPVLLQSSLLLIFSGQCVLRIFLRYLLTKFCSFFDRACHTFQVPDPQRSGALTFEEVKMRNLILLEIDEAFQTGLSGGSPIGLAGCGIWRFFAVIFGIFELKTRAGRGITITSGSGI